MKNHVSENDMLNASFLTTSNFYFTSNSSNYLNMTYYKLIMRSEICECYFEDIFKIIKQNSSSNNQNEMPSLKSISFNTSVFEIERFERVTCSLYKNHVSIK